MNRLTVSLGNNRAYRNGRAVKLSAIEAEILFILNREYPETATQHTVISGVYGPAIACNSERCETFKVSTHISRLKRKLAPIKATVRSVRGVGYQLVLS